MEMYSLIVTTNNKRIIMRLKKYKEINTCSITIMLTKMTVKTVHL